MRVRLETDGVWVYISSGHIGSRHLGSMVAIARHNWTANNQKTNEHKAKQTILQPLFYCVAEITADPSVRCADKQAKGISDPTEKLISFTLILHALFFIALQFGGTCARCMRLPSSSLLADTNSKDGKLSEARTSSVANTSTMSQLRARRKAAKMLVVVVVLFAVCFLPIHCLNILR